MRMSRAGRYSGCIPCSIFLARGSAARLVAHRLPVEAHGQDGGPCLNGRVCFPRRRDK